MDSYNYYGKNNLPKRRSLLSYLITAIAGAIIGGMLVLIFAPTFLLQRVVPNDNNAGQSEGTEKIVIPAKTEVSQVTAVSKKVMPAVVGIRTTEYQYSMFFGRQKMEGVGSGVIVDKRGYILTNNHVAGMSASDITVSLADGRNLAAKVLWANEGLDLSIIKIDADNLTTAELGDSDKIEVGELAVAIGNPLGLRFERSVTSGIISALNRTIPMDDGTFMEDLIQTDASINQGNSGGPLINSEGKVIGINTVKVQTAEGMGFAIPINVAAPVVKSFVEKGEFITPYMGISGLDKEVASVYDFELDKGIYIYSIDNKGPAYKAGLRKGDIILEINGQPVNTTVALTVAIYKAGVGSQIEIKYQDGFKNIKTTTVTLGQYK